MPPRTPSAIPVGTQFSPTLVHLGPFVRALVARSGDKAGLERGIWADEVRVAPVRRAPTRRRRSLPLEAAVQYGLLERGTYAVTELAQRLAALEPPQLYDEFARHILLNCGGLRVVDGVEQMRADGLDITGDSLAGYLTDQGFPVTIHNTAINSMRMWLAKAGLFPAISRGSNLWALDREAKKRLVGLDDEAISVLAGLNAEQRAFVEALCRIAPSGWYLASDVRALAEANSGLRLRRESLPGRFLEPLKAIGLIEYRTSGTSSGKSTRLRTTDVFNAQVLEAFVTRTVRDLDAVTAAYYKKRPEDIYAELASSDAPTKGRALEAYAVHLMRLLGLRFLEWRERAGATTGWAEVDAVFAGVTGVAPTRWQVQCKNTPGSPIDIGVVAREVGR